MTNTVYIPITNGDKMQEQKKVCVIGGGAAGMMAAGTAILYGADVTIFEHTDRLGKKLAITGKGRCNVTNASTIQEFLENVPRNPRSLYSALNAFSPDVVLQVLAARLRQTQCWLNTLPRLPPGTLPRR